MRTAALASPGSSRRALLATSASRAPTAAAVSVLQHGADLLGDVKPAREQADSDDVRRARTHRERLLAKDSERRSPRGVDPVDRTRRTTTYLLAAHELYELLGFELVQLPVERPRAQPAPGLDVHGVSPPAQLVAVHRTVFSQQAEDDYARQAHVVTLAYYAVVVKLAERQQFAVGISLQADGRRNGGD